MERNIWHYNYQPLEHSNRRYSGVMLGVMAISGGIAAAGAISSANSSSNSYKYQAKVAQMRGYLARRTADQNITLVKQNEEQNTTATQFDASEASAANMRGLSKVRGAQTATLAANGMGGSVTAADIATDTFDAAKRDEMAIRYNADAKSAAIANNANQQIWNLNNEAANAEWGANVESAQDTMAAGNARTAGYFGAANSIMGAASSYSMARMRYGGGYNTNNQAPSALSTTQ
jgi:hypothetical protein